MVTIREIKNLEDLKAFYGESPESLHIVKIGAPWCGPCRMLSSTLHGLESDKIYDSLIADVNIDEDDAEPIAGEYNVRSIPVLLFVKNNEVVHKFTGSLNANAIYEKIEEFK